MDKLAQYHDIKYYKGNESTNKQVGKIRVNKRIKCNYYNANV